MSKRSILYWCALATGLILAGNVAIQAQSTNPRIVLDKVNSIPSDYDLQVRVLYHPGSAFAADLGYFNLLIQFDPDALTLLSVEEGTDLTACGWESFSWAPGALADCGSLPCPAGVVRITARGDVGNPPPGPVCLVNGMAEIAVLNFHSSADAATWACQYSPISFIWHDCNDNIAMESIDSSAAYVSATVWDVDGTTQITQNLPFPTVYGAPETCVPSGIPGKDAERAIDFQRGGVDFLCIDSIDSRGDINLNGIAYEIADWVLFTNFLVLGPAVFYNPVVQIEVSDCNANGLPVELNDMVYLYRVVIGDANPFPRPVVSPNATAIVTQDGNTSTIRIKYPGNITHAWFVFGDSIVPASAFQTHVAAYDDAYTTPYTRVLVLQANQGDPPTNFPSMDTGRVVIGYTGSGTLLYAELASDGLENIPVQLEYNNVPPCCVLRGNVNGIDQINIADLTTLVGFLFQGSFPPPPCPEEADVDGLGGSSPITVSDITYLVSYLFQSGTPPPPCQ